VANQSLSYGWRAFLSCEGCQSHPPTRTPATLRVVAAQLPYSFGRQPNLDEIRAHNRVFIDLLTSDAKPSVVANRLFNWCAASASYASTDSLASTSAADSTSRSRIARRAS
jgi:hypothetical protein